MINTKVRKALIRGTAVTLLTVIMASAAVGCGKKEEPASQAPVQEESAGAIRETIRTAARQCYVVEGVYPPDLEYLEENYRVKINHKDFYVTYEAYAQNLPPTVKVTVRQ